MSLRRSLPFLRWSFLRMMFGIRRLLRDWQVGDGREEQCARYVEEHARKGDLDGVIAAIDRYAYDEKFLINIGDEKGAILDAIITRVRPARMLELGAYVGYSALRTVRRLPANGHLYSIELNAANAAIARRMADHAGVANRVTFVHGTLGDGGATVRALGELGFGAGNLDMVFIDHDKHMYRPDLERLLTAGWLHPGSVVVADNVGFPGAPEYKAYMAREEGRRWRTTWHDTHAEYQSMFRDVVLESVLL